MAREERLTPQSCTRQHVHYLTIHRRVSGDFNRTAVNRPSHQETEF